MSIVQHIYDWIWAEWIWLPPGIHWSDLKSGARPGVEYANSKDLYYPIALALVMIIIRFFLEKYFFKPFALMIGMKEAKNRPKLILNGSVSVNDSILEQTYKENDNNLKHKQITGLAKRLDVNERQIQRWLRERRKLNKPTKLVKFCENAWRFFYYTHSFLFGVWVLWDKPWLWNIKECLYNYPHHTITNDVWWYYMLSMSFYWSLCVSQFFDVKHKDFWQMFIHHIATVSLMCFSWVCNLHRIGSLVLVIHDCADIFLEAAKMAKYANYQKTCDIIFGIFTILWIITRLGLFPFWIIYNTTITATSIVPLFPAYFIFNGLLIVLFILHIFWTWIILQVAIKAICSGQMEGDIRSESESMSN